MHNSLKVTCSSSSPNLRVVFPLHIRVLLTGYNCLFVFLLLRLIKAYAVCLAGGLGNKAFIPFVLLKLGLKDMNEYGVSILDIMS